MKFARLEVAATSQRTPGDPRELIGKRGPTGGASSVGVTPAGQKHRGVAAALVRRKQRALLATTLQDDRARFSFFNRAFTARDRVSSPRGRVRDRRAVFATVAGSFEAALVADVEAGSFRIENPYARTMRHSHDLELGALMPMQWDRSATKHPPMFDLKHWFKPIVGPAYYRQDATPGKHPDHRKDPIRNAVLAHDGVHRYRLSQPLSCRTLRSGQA